jgi:hypothetical protein
MGTPAPASSPRWYDLGAMARLFRPVGMHELALIWDKEFREFPPRLPHQPIFYPVINYDYARQIAAEWNVKDEASAYCGFVTRFDVADDYISRLAQHLVGASIHTEYWISANQLSDFNSAIHGRIEVEEGFFGDEFRGFVPERFGLRGKEAVEQFTCLANTWDYSRMDFVIEAVTNSKAVFLNSWFWAKYDFSRFGIDAEQKRRVFENLRNAWESHEIEAPLPCDFRERD